MIIHSECVSLSTLHQLKLVKGNAWTKNTDSSITFNSQRSLQVALVLNVYKLSMNHMGPN